MSARRATLLSIVVACGGTVPANADAIVVSRAMTASTIAEVFVEPDEIRVELEIGGADLAAFRNVMPDGVYEKLGGEPAPLDRRRQRFFEEDWVVRLDGGEPIGGEIADLEVRRRVARDEITGEPIASGAEEGEPVVFLVLRYRDTGRPPSLSITPPGDATANVGFVTYHHGLPVNDFRYLGRTETLDLDWDDPWYSRFRNRNLRRQYDAPITAFLYVDAFEVRKEIVLRPVDLAPELGLDLDLGRDIPAAAQPALLALVAEHLAERCPVTIDGRSVEPVLDRIHFIRRSLRQTGVIDPAEDLPAISATLGVIFAYPVTELPEEVAMTFDLFSERSPRVPAVATDEAGGLPTVLTPDEPVLLWRNFLTNPTSRALTAIEPPPEPTRVTVPLVTVACLLAAGLVGGRSLLTRARPSGLGLAVMAIALAGGVLAWPVARVSIPLAWGAPSMPETDARRIAGGLLQNVYRAFDFREEGDIYDTLAHSVDGDLLTRIYLETRRALELRNQGGARAKVNEVAMTESSTTPVNDGAGFVSRCQWTVSGSVGHWGHIHRRRNRYEAVLTIQPVDGVWKITDLQLLEEQRLDPPTRT